MHNDFLDGEKLGLPHTLPCDLMGGVRSASLFYDGLSNYWGNDCELGNGASAG